MSIFEVEKPFFCAKKEMGFKKNMCSKDMCCEILLKITKYITPNLRVSSSAISTRANCNLTLEINLPQRDSLSNTLVH